MSEETFLRNPPGIQSQKVLDSKIEEGVKDVADSSGRIPKGEDLPKIMILYFLFDSQCMPLCEMMLCVRAVVSPAAIRSVFHTKSEDRCSAIVRVSLQDLSGVREEEEREALEPGRDFLEKPSGIPS